MMDVYDLSLPIVTTPRDVLFPAPRLTGARQNDIALSPIGGVIHELIGHRIQNVNKIAWAILDSRRLAPQRTSAEGSGPWMALTIPPDISRSILLFDGDGGVGPTIPPGNVRVRHHLPKSLFAHSPHIRHAAGIGHH